MIYILREEDIAEVIYSIHEPDAFLQYYNPLDPNCTYQHTTSILGHPKGYIRRLIEIPFSKEDRNKLENTYYFDLIWDEDNNSPARIEPKELSWQNVFSSLAYELSRYENNPLTKI